MTAKQKLPQTGCDAMRIDVITIFPDYLAPLQLSLVGKAQQSELIDLRIHDLRDFATDRHRTVDDSPYGGGPGMVMKADVWGAAIDVVLQQRPYPEARATIVVPTPTGAVFSHDAATSLATQDWLVFLPARYEGMDGRVVEHYRVRDEVADVREISIGDFVLAGGEAAVLVMVEALARFVPGVLGNEESATDDSFADGTAGRLAGPAFTRPPVWRGIAIPEILLSGDHARIAAWRAEQSRLLTAERRPDLLEPKAHPTN
jgi:tRNA (guanine37-N1)-methyltransferase